MSTIQSFVEKKVGSCTVNLYLCLKIGYTIFKLASETIYITAHFYNEKTGTSISRIHPHDSVRACVTIFISTKFHHKKSLGNSRV